MAKSEAATPALISTLHEAVASRGLRTIARDSGVHHTTIKRALSGAHVNADALIRLSRIAPKVRTADEFDGALKSAVSAPVRNQSGCSWTLESIRSARDCQMNGDFQQPVRLAEALRTDDALYTAYHNRIAPLNCLASTLDACGGARGEAVRRRALASAFVSRSVLAGIDGTLANHGVAIGYIEQEVNDDGTQIDFRLTEWPLEFVRYDQSRDVLTTKVRNGGMPVDIIHGNGRWIIFRKFNVRPWNQEAALLPASFAWAAHSYGMADWMQASRSHGLAKVMGELPEGYSLADKDGILTDQARSYLQALSDLMNGDAVAGLRPFGAKSEYMANGSTAWQVFAELILDRKKAAAAIYQGTDATLGAAGGAPGVDIATLFGVATTKVQGDITAIEDALYSGFYVPWTAINCGDSRYAPRMKYQIPDPDEDAKREQNSANRGRLIAAIKDMREQKLEVEQADVDRIAAEYGVTPAPRLASIDKQTSTLVLAPTDIAKVIRVSEARASQGLPAFGDARDNMTITELDEFMRAKSAGTGASAGEQTPAPTAPTATARTAVALDVTHRPAGTPEGGQFAPDGSGTSGGGGNADAPKGGSAKHKKALDVFKAAEQDTTDRAAKRAAELKPALAAAKSKASAASRASEADFERAGFKDGAPEEIYSYVSARDQLANARENSGGRGTNAFSDADVAKYEAKHAAAKAAASSVTAKLAPGSVERLNASIAASEAADDIAAEHAAAASFVKQAPARKKAVTEYEAAIASRNPAKVQKAKDRISALVNADGFAADPETGDIDPTFREIIDGDGDGLLNEEEKD